MTTFKETIPVYNPLDFGHKQPKMETRTGSDGQ